MKVTASESAAASGLRPKIPLPQRHDEHEPIQVIFSDRRIQSMPVLSRRFETYTLRSAAYSTPKFFRFRLSFVLICGLRDLTAAAYAEADLHRHRLFLHLIPECVICHTGAKRRKNRVSLRRPNVELWVIIFIVVVRLPPCSAVPGACTWLSVLSAESHKIKSINSPGQPTSG